jgi:hypothetical protein
MGRTLLRDNSVADAVFARAQLDRAPLRQPAGRNEAIKEYSLGLTVFDRGASFDPKADTIVRVQARRLRAKLAEYYEHSSQTAAVIIDLPKGAYIPVFTAGPRVSRTKRRCRRTSHKILVLPIPGRRAVLLVALAAAVLVAGLVLPSRARITPSACSTVSAMTNKTVGCTIYGSQKQTLLYRNFFFGVTGVCEKT